MKIQYCIMLLICVCLCSCRTTEPKAKTKSSLRVASLMYLPTKWDKDANRDRLDAIIRQAKAQGAELIVTPEGALEGYLVNEVRNATGDERAELTERFNAIAEPCDGPYIQHFQTLCKELEVYLVLGFLEAEGTNTYNAAILIAPDGTMAGKYRKTHFAQGYINGLEKKNNPYGYTRGTTYPVFEIQGRKMGIMICYDRRVPKVSANLVANGAQFIINPAYGMMGDCNCRFISARIEENHVPILLVHPNQTVYGNEQGEIVEDIRPALDDPRIAIVTI